MNLKETIRKVLREEEKKKDLSVPIKKLVDLFLEQSKDKDYICGYDLGLGKFAIKHSGERYQRFKITLYFDSGQGSKNWPMTQAVRWREEDIMRELQDLIIDTFGILVDMYSSSRPNCKKIEESVLKEEATDTEYAVIEILKPSSRMSQKWYFQAVPLNKTEHDKIYIKRGPAGILTISTKNIKIHKIFKNSEKEEMDKYLEKLREQDKKKGEQKEGLHDTSWENDGEKITLVDLLDATDDIPVENVSVEELKPHLLTWDGDEEEFKKIEKADLKYPILIFVEDDGEFISIIDGHHRAQKAVRKGLETIKAKIIPINNLPKKIRKVFGHMGKQEQNESELTEKCWKGYTQKGMKTMFGKRYPNCVKKTK